MPLTSCPACQGKVSDRAPACVGCGKPLPARRQKGRFLRWMMIAAGVLAAIPILLLAFFVGHHRNWGKPPDWAHSLVGKEVAFSCYGPEYRELRPHVETIRFTRIEGCSILLDWRPECGRKEESLWFTFFFADGEQESEWARRDREGEAFRLDLGGIQSKGRAILKDAHPVRMRMALGGKEQVFDLE